MTSLELPEVSSPHFSTQATYDGNLIRVHLAGNADLHAKDALESLLTRLHAEIQRLGASEVTVDLHDLEFMNSSCFKSFVSWISAVQDLNADKQYRIRFLSNPAMLWQRRSLHALKCFAIDLIQIEQ